MLLRLMKYTPPAILFTAALLCYAAADAAAPLPWLNAPVAEPLAVVNPTVAQHACADADLRMVVGKPGAHHGFATQEIQLTNIGGDACYLSGSPEVQLLPSNAAPQTLARHPEASPTVFQRADLAPGETAVLLIGTPGSCDAAVGSQRNVSTRLQIAAPGGGKHSLEGAHVDTLCGNATVLHLHVLRNAPVATSPLAALTGSVSVTGAVSAGSVLDYTVTLTNPTANSIALLPCPSYTQELYADGTKVAYSVLLNCAAAGSQLAAGASVSFDMQLQIPGNLPPGPVKLSWSLQGGPSLGALLSLH